MILGDEVRVSQRLACERQKDELRRERDRIVLDLSRSLGMDGLATCLGTTPAATDALVQGARGRLAEQSEQIAARRRGPADAERWAAADRYYEALGSTVRLPGERRGRF